MARLHLRFKDFHLEALSATEELFESKPWRYETDDEKAAAAQAWADRLAVVYSVPKVHVVIGEQIESDPRERRDALDAFDDSEFFGDEDDPLAYRSMPSSDDEQVMSINDEEEVQELAARPKLRLSHWSLVVLFKRWREYMLANGFDAHNRYADDDVIGWSYSLFYRVRPRMFRARVREGRIPRVYPDDLLKTETIRQRDEDRTRQAEDRARAEMAADVDAEFEDIEEENYDIGDDDEGAISDGARTQVIGPSAIDDNLTKLLGLSRDRIRELARINNVPRGNRNKDELAAVLYEKGVRA